MIEQQCDKQCLQRVMQGRKRSAVHVVKKEKTRKYPQYSLRMYRGDMKINAM